MAVSDAIRMVLAKRNKKAIHLTKAWGLSRNAIYNKFIRDSWSGHDLVKFADLTHCRLAFVFKDGQQIFIEETPEQEATPLDAYDDASAKPDTDSEE